jgi:hypothetical protein
MNLTKIPEHMREGVVNYVHRGIRPGSFLEAVLCNDLVRAASNADELNACCLYEWAEVLVQELPISCWGSPEKVQAWLTKGGLSGG